MFTSSKKDLIIYGYYIDDNGNKSKKKNSIKVTNGKIVSIKEESPKKGNNQIVLKLDDNQLIFPGFLDLHTHIEYNMIPNWDYGEYPWNNRHEWRHNSEYKEKISYFHSDIIKRWAEISKIINKKETINDFRILGEIQAITGGSTVLQETEEYSAKDNSFKESDHLLIRSTGNAEDLGRGKDKLFFSVIDFYKPKINGVDPAGNKPTSNTPKDTSKWYPEIQSKLRELREIIHTPVLQATLVHLAEGRTGFLKDDCDGYSRAEFETFMEEMKNYSSYFIQEKNISIIHGCGIDSKNKEHIQFLKDYGINILWAPISNSLLYHDTLDILEFLKNDINVALGSDWSPSGGKNVLDEAKFAYEFCKAICLKKPTYKDEEIQKIIYKMITVNPAKCLGKGTPLGTIKEGYMGDFVIFNSDENKSPIKSLLEDSDSKIHCVIVNGRVLYGDKEVFDNLGITPQLLHDSETSNTKCLSINSCLNFNIDEAIDKIEMIFNSNANVKWVRSKFLVSDDMEYIENIKKIKEKMISQI